MHLSRAFTLVELMVTLAILAILLAIAAPSFNGVIQTNRTQSIANNVMTAMQFARSEAINRRTNVEVCRSVNSTSATPTCSTGTAWQAGWLVTVTGGEVLRVWEPLTGKDQVTGPNGALVFRASGMRDGTGELEFVIKSSNCTGKTQYTVKVLATGRVTNEKGSCS